MDSTTRSSRASSFDETVWLPLHSEQPSRTSNIHHEDWDTLASRGFTLVDLHRALLLLPQEDRICIGDRGASSVYLLSSSKLPPTEDPNPPLIEFHCYATENWVRRGTRHKFIIGFDPSGHPRAIEEAIHGVLVFLCKSAHSLFAERCTFNLNKMSKFEVNHFNDDDSDDNDIVENPDNEQHQNQNDVPHGDQDIAAPGDFVGDNGHDHLDNEAHADGQLDTESLGDDDSLHDDDDPDEDNFEDNLEEGSESDNSDWDDLEEDILLAERARLVDAIVDRVVDKFFAWFGVSGVVAFEMLFSGIRIRPVHYPVLRTAYALQFDDCYFLGGSAPKLSADAKTVYVAAQQALDKLSVELGLLNMVPFLDQLRHLTDLSLFVYWKSNPLVVQHVVDVLCNGSVIRDQLVNLDLELNGPVNAKDFVGSLACCLTNMPLLKDISIETPRPSDDENPEALHNTPSIITPELLGDELNRAFASQYRLTRVEFVFNGCKEERLMTFAKPFLKRNEAFEGMQDLCHKVYSDGEKEAMQLLGACLSRFGKDPNFVFHVARCAAIIKGNRLSKKTPKSDPVATRGGFSLGSNVPAAATASGSSGNSSGVPKSGPVATGGLLSFGSFEPSNPFTFDSSQPPPNAEGEGTTDDDFSIPTC